MPILLKCKRVFGDTQVFRAARFAVTTPSLANLGEFCEARELTLLTTEITRSEIDTPIPEVAAEMSKVLKSGRIRIFIAPGMRLPARLGAGFGQRVEKKGAIRVVIENGFTMVTAVHDMVNRPAY